MGDRKYYIDNLRWLWIVLLIPFHAAMAWNCWESNYIWFSPNKILSSLVIFMAPWYMPLLFVLAGMSMRYAMRRRSYGQFALERVKKLLIPLVAGTMTVVALMTFMADKYHDQYTGSFFEHYGVFLATITDLTGYDGSLTPGHLWFLLYLFIISFLILVVIVIQRKILPKLSFAGLKTFVLPLLMIIPVIMTPILDFGGKSIGADFGLVLLGYYVISEEEVLEKMSKYRYVYLAIMLVSDVILTYLFVWDDNRLVIIESVCQAFASWFGILAFIGIARCNFNQNNKLTSYMASRSFMIYIFHFGWLVVIQYYLFKISQSTIVIYFSSVILALVMTLLTCEVVRRIPGISFLFGVKHKAIK